MFYKKTKIFEKVDWVFKFLISSFISLYYFWSLLIKTNLSLPINESIKALEIKTSMLFNLDFDNKTILSCFFFFFLRIDLCFLIPAAIVQTFNPIAELVIPIKISIREAKVEIEVHPVIVETKKKEVLNII